MSEENAVPQSGNEALEERDPIAEIREMRELVQAAEEQKRKDDTVAAIHAAEAKAKEDKAAAKVQEEKAARPKHPYPGLKVGTTIQRDSQEEFLIAVNRDMFYKMVIHHVQQCQPGYAIPNVRHVAAALGITDWEEAQVAWRKIQAEHLRRLQYA